jgi:CRISPR/Cas system-associated exonuclease Cas4 (RecB family)
VPEHLSDRLRLAEVKPVVVGRAVHRPLHFADKDSKESLRNLAARMLQVLCDNVQPGVDIVSVEQPFAAPLIDQETGEVLERDLVGSIDLVEREAGGRVTVVDLKTAARKYSDLQAEASLQLSVYSYATSMNGLGDQEDVRLRFDVLTKTKQPELHRYWTTRDRAANLRLFRLASELLRAIQAEVFYPNPGWQCKDCQFRSRCWAWR